MNSKEIGLEKIKELVIRFNEQIVSYKKLDYNETQTRRDFIDPFFKALGWDIDNKQGYAENYREVIHEDRIKVGKATKAPDYSFRIGGGNRLFFVEAKKPSVVIKDDMQPAYQVRRYGWSAKLNVSIITDFEEFAIYDCTKKPNPNDKSSTARIKYITFNEYENEWDFMWNTFSKEAVLKGNFDKFIKGNANKKGTATVDKEFLLSLDQWRTLLAESISKENKQLDEDELNFVVQQTLDRIIFLRICEDRAIENYGNLQNATKNGEYYQNFLQLFKDADDKYNSGLFNFKKDQVSQQLKINNKTLKTITTQLYYPESPYEFSVIDVEILGSAYEQFLGKTITINNRGKAVIELKPEVRKAGGVYYTPQYIVDYIVANTVGKLTLGFSPLQVAEIKIVDPACGSGSFLLGAYQYLLDWHIDYYTKNPEEAKKQKAFTPLGALSTAIKKQILLNNIYGVDIDTNAVEVTKLSLLLKCMEGETQASIAHQMSMFKERILPTLDDNIKSGNSLIDTDYYDNQLDFGEERKIKPFNWQKAFPEVFNRNVKIDETLRFKEQYNKVKKLEDETQDFIDSIVSEPLAEEYGKKYNGGFDVVIGNPPYVDSEEMTKTNLTLRNYAINKFFSAKGNWDMYCIYSEKAVSLLNPRGKFGFIIPNKFLSAPYGIHLKQFLSKFQVSNIDDYSSVNVFVSDRKINVYPIILLIDKNEIIKTGVYTKYHEKNNEIIKVYKKDYSINENETEWTSKFSLGDEIIDKIFKKSSLINSHFFIENSATVNEAYLIKEILEDKVSIDSLKLINTGTIDRYSNLWGVSKTQYIKDSYLTPSINKLKLYKIIPNRVKNIIQKRIVLAGMVKNLEATIIDENYYSSKSTSIILSKDLTKYKLEYLLGLLNSRLLSYIFIEINKHNSMSGGYLNVSKKQLDNFIFKSIDFSNEQETHYHNQIVNHVEQLLQLNKDLQAATLESKKEQLKTKIDYHEDKINALVYALYELTEEEIKIIEND